MSFTAKGEAAAASPAAAAAAAAVADAAPAGGWRAVLAAFPLGPVLVNPLTLIKSPRFWRSVVGEFVATAMFLAVTVGVVISGNYDTAIVDATTTVALAGAMTVDAAVTGCCEVAESQTPVLGVAVPYAVGNVVLTVLGPIIVACTFTG